MTPDEVKSIRKRLGRTQAEMAELIGVTLGAFQHWEYGVRNPSKPAQKLMRAWARQVEDN